MTAERLGLKRLLSLAKRYLTLEMPKLAHRLIIDKPSQEILGHVRTILKDHPELALILAFGHVSYPDPWFIYRVCEEYLDPERARDLYILASEWHMRKNPLFIRAAKVASQLPRCEFVPTIQKYMIETDEAMREWGYTPVDVSRNRRFLVKKLSNMRNGIHPHGITLFVAPEGTRSPDGTLKKGDSAVGGIFRKLSPAIILPMGINYIRIFNRGLNIGNPAEIVVGEPIEVARNTVPSHEKIMTSISWLLPTELQGQWPVAGV